MYAMQSLCYGILPMAGKGSRLQPIAFSKELYPIVHRGRHFAVSEFSIRAMLRAKVDEIKLVVHPDKIDIAKYFAASTFPISLYFHTQPPYSLPDSSWVPLAGLHDNDICLFGLSDTLFTPVNGYQKIRKEIEKGVDIALGLFEVPDASLFDSVKLDPHNRVQGVLVKKSPPLSNWIWGIWGGRVSAIRHLQQVIKKQKPPSGSERLLGVGFDTLATQGKWNIKGVKLGRQYFDIGTMEAVLNIQEILKDFEI